MQAYGELFYFFLHFATKSAIFSSKHPSAHHISKTVVLSYFANLRDQIRTTVANPMTFPPRRYSLRAFLTSAPELLHNIR